MQKKQEQLKKLQWHPAFYAGIQIELEEEHEKLIFENEHQLNTKPLGIDVLMIKELRRTRKVQLEKFEEGIYHLIGDAFPIQLIHTSKLSEENNFWLKNLTNDLKGTEEAQKLLKAYEKRKRENLYQSVMNVIVKANIALFEEVEEMCDALMEIVQPKVDAKIREACVAAREEACEEVKCEVIRKKLAKGLSVEEIAEWMEEPVGTIRSLVQSIS